MRRFAIALVAACAATPALSVEPNPDLIKQAAATAGGEIVVQSALFDSTNKDFAQGFNAKYGSRGLHVKVVRYQSSQQVQLYDQELRAGKVSGDVLFFVEPPLFVRLAREDKLTKYCSPNFADYRPEALTPDCSYFYVNSYLQYLAYNPDLMSQPPTSWNDLIDSKWKGKISIPDPKIGGLRSRARVVSIRSENGGSDRAGDSAFAAQSGRRSSASRFAAGDRQSFGALGSCLLQFA